MNQVSVTGGTKRQRDIVHRVTAFVIKQLMPRMRTLDIEIKLKNIKSAAIGYCMEGDTNREFEIEIDRNIGLLSMASTVAHELVHVKQYARREMDSRITSGLARWKGRRVREDTPYDQLPWEVEAYRMERELINKMVDSDLF